MDANRDMPDDRGQRPDTPRQPRSAEAPVRRALVASGVTLALVIAGLAAAWIAAEVAHSINPQRCWGCSPDGPFVVFILGILYAPAAGVTIILTWVLWAATRRAGDETNRTATWTPSALFAALIVLAIWFVL